jgi:hypothetical protein
VHLLVDGTGLKLCGAGEWLAEKHGIKRRRAWRVLHLATDADTGRIDGAVASFTSNGAYDRDDVYAEVAARHPAAAVVVPPRANAVPSKAAEIAPTQRGRMGWQRASGYGWRARGVRYLALEARHRRWAPFANGRTAGDRGGNCGRRAEPNAGPRTPGVRPHRITRNAGRAQCAPTADPCNKAPSIGNLGQTTAKLAIMAETYITVR